jgi:hypothetical protein
VPGIIIYHEWTRRNLSQAAIPVKMTSLRFTATLRSVKCKPQLSGPQIPAGGLRSNPCPGQPQCRRQHHSEARRCKKKKKSQRASDRDGTYTVRYKARSRTGNRPALQCNCPTTSSSQKQQPVRPVTAAMPAVRLAAAKTSAEYLQSMPLLAACSRLLSPASYYFY